MAIQLAYTSKHGVVASKAVHHIVKMDYDHLNTTCTCQIHIYQTADDKTNGNAPLETMEFSFTPSVADDGKNFLAQGYIALKLLSTVKDERSGTDKSINYGSGKDV